MVRKPFLTATIGFLATVLMASLAAAQAPSDPCSPPTVVTGSAEETAWRIFVAATCPVNQNQYPFVVWENWVEQVQSYPANPLRGLSIPSSLANLINKTHQLHG